MSISRMEVLMMAGGMTVLGTFAHSLDKMNAKREMENKQIIGYQQTLKNEIGADKFEAVKKSIDSTNCLGSDCLEQWRKTADSTTNAKKMFEAGKKFVLDSISNASKTIK